MRFWRSTISLVLIAALWAPAFAQDTATDRALADEPDALEQPPPQAIERLREVGLEGDDVGAEVEEEIIVPPAEDLETAQLVFYASARARLTGVNGETRISDNESRVGVVGSKFISSRTDLFTRVELGTDLGGELDRLLIPGGNPPPDSSGIFFLRLATLGIGTSYGDVSFGKQWSTFYNVAGYTDRFAVFGAAGTAVYNAGTDGGGTGTGRADNSVKYQWNRERLSLGLQAQDNTDIPLAGGRQYDAGAAFSLEYDISSTLSAGVAYNHAFIDQLDLELMALGLSGDSQNGVVGLQYQKEPIYIATTFARHKNHETTDQNKYIDATGWELYARYNVSDRFRVIGGANVLEPDNDDPNAGQYEIRSAILGLQYTYASNATYGNIIYLEIELQDGRNVDGSKRDNAFTVGARYSFDY